MFQTQRERLKSEARFRFIGGIKIREMPDVDRILQAYRLCRETWRFYPRLGVEGHPTACLYPIGDIRSTGYRTVQMFGQGWAEHRLIWKVMTRREPNGLIDHLNGIRDDNRFENLRDVTPQGNALNAVRGRFAADMTARKIVEARLKAEEKQAKADRKERRERAKLAILKAKYEN